MSEQGAKLVKLKFNFCWFLPRMTSSRNQKANYFFLTSQSFLQGVECLWHSQSSFHNSVLSFDHVSISCFLNVFSGFLKSFEDLITSFENWLFGACVVQRSLKVSFFCANVITFSENLYIRLFSFFSCG